MAPTNAQLAYAELSAISNYSFLQGASHPQELVNQAKDLGYQAIAITDYCSLAGVVRAHVAAAEKQLKLIIGTEIHTEDDLRAILLVTDDDSYADLCELISLGRRRSGKGEYQLYAEDLLERKQQLILLWLPTLSQCQQWLQHLQAEAQAPQSPHHVVEPLPAWFELLLQWRRDNRWIALENRLRAEDAALLRARRRLAQQLNWPRVACGRVLMHSVERQPLQDVLTAIHHNVSLAQAGFHLQPNAEAHLRPLEILTQRFQTQELLASVEIAGRCHFSLGNLRYQYPKETVPAGLAPMAYLRQLVAAGARQRWPQGKTEKVAGILAKELALIEELEYAYYFLTVYDIVRFARSQDILCQGRGSAANSAVCFCLFITEVDPATAHLLFERFISKERNEPPDIDVDFEHQRREEVIQYIYRKYGRHRTGLVASVISYKRKSAVRDLGKVMGFDESLLSLLNKSMAWWDKPEQLAERLQALGLNPQQPALQQFIQLFQQLLGFPRHLSQHVGGFVISEPPLQRLVPIENAAMEGRTLIQWDKDDAEALGLMKIDVLALGMLSAIRHCLALLSQWHGRPWTMASIPKEDPATYQMLQQGDSIGVFQVESRAQMAMLPRLKPACFYDLVIEIAIVRPGPIQGDMVHPYLQRRHGKAPVEYVSEAVQTVLERTLGVPIFQEQVIELAMVAAGFSAGEADQLRRAMASWRKKGELHRYQQKLLQGMLERGYELQFAERIIEQINGFGEYGFPESHAASFALLAYISAWLKCHEPVAFCCALLNSQPMGFYSPSQLIQDLRRHQGEVRPVDVQYSDWQHGLESADKKSQQPALRLGLCLIKGLAKQTANKILAARKQQAFQNLPDLQQRAALTKAELELLAVADALCSLTGNRRNSQWQVLGLEPLSPLNMPPQPQARVALPSQTAAQQTLTDYAYLGLSLKKHPIALLRQHPAFKGCKTRRETEQLPHGRFVRVAGLVAGRQRPGTAKGTLFITLEDETGNHNLVIWKDLLLRRRSVLLQAQLLKVKGVIERGESVVHIVVGDVEDMSPLLQGLNSSSRDFH